TAFSDGRRDRNSILRAREVLDAMLEWIPAWENDPANAYRGAKAIVNVGAVEGGFGWRASRTPHHTDLFLDVRVPPTKAMAVARREVLDMVRGLAERFPDYGVEGEVFVTAPGAEIEEGHELVAAIDAAHAEVWGEPPGRDVTRWFSDASALTRYGVPTVNYGTSTRAAADPECRCCRGGTGPPARAGARRNRARSATSTRISACRSLVSRPRRSTTSSSSPSGTGCRSR